MLDKVKILKFKWLLKNPELLDPETAEFIRNTQLNHITAQLKSGDAYARAILYDELVDKFPKTIKQSKSKIYPLNITELEKLIELIDFMIEMNQGTEIEEYSLKKNIPHFKEIKKTIRREISNIQKDYKSEEKKNNLESFEKLFKKISSYNKIMQILVEHGYCAPGTYTWIDEKSGNKKFLVSIIKTIQIRRFLKVKGNLTPKQIQYIALNTFNVDVSESLIEKHKLNKVESKILEFIPIASTI